jgi:hypothetical protein
MAYIEVDVDLSEFSDEELMEELEARGLYESKGINVSELVDKIYQLRRLRKNFDKELDLLLYDMTDHTL